MGGTYQAGEEKVRPGVYRRYTTQDKKLVAGAMTGVFAIPVKADFGPCWNCDNPYQTGQCERNVWHGRNSERSTEPF